MTTDEFDKRKKAHGEEVDISNGALFLRIVDLERTVKFLERELAKVQNEVQRHERSIDFKVGGGYGC